MQVYNGKIVEQRLSGENDDACATLLISCPTSAIPAAGQYLIAHCPQEIDAVAGVILYRAGYSPADDFSPDGRADDETLDRFLAFGECPDSWRAGTNLQLRGPLGRGFSPPTSATRFILAALGNTVERLLPVVATAMRNSSAVALFTDLQIAALPSEIEIQPLSGLPDSLAWGDYLALDIHHQRLPDLRRMLNIDAHTPPACPTQVLVDIAMPCGGIAECGVCALPARRGYTLACIDGPVFDIEQLDW